MTVVLSALRTELLTDPGSGGYSAWRVAGDHNMLAALLNRAVNSAVSVGTVHSLDLQQAVVATEYAVISAGQRDLWNAIVTAAVNGIAISNTVLRNQVAQVWSAGTTTRTNLLSLDSRTGTRAEVLFGEGTVVTVQDVSTALSAF